MNRIEQIDRRIRGQHPEQSESGEMAAGDTVSLVLLGKAPEDDRFVAGGGDNHIEIVDRSSNGGNHVSVRTHGAAENETLSHGCCEEEIVKMQLGFGCEILRVIEGDLRETEGFRRQREIFLFFFFVQREKRGDERGSEF